MEKPRTLGRRVFGYFFYFVSFLCCLAAIDGGSGRAGWLFTAAVAFGLGWLILRPVRRDPLAARQLAVLRLAAAEDGQLTVTEIAAKLGWTLEVAKATLVSMEDGVRVTTTFTDEGILLYNFPELIHDPGRRPALPPEPQTPAETAREESPPPRVR
jgi:hypothetical protein